MIVTPAQAAEKLCPQALPVVGTPGSGPVSLYCFCRGPACLAWRWAAIDATELHRRGYCGLAGLPSEP